MTDTSSTSTTHSIPTPFPVAAPTVPPTLNGSLPSTGTPQEEDYTIKCICDYSDDDGNTVFCERCETWQHIDCYYPTGEVPEVHLCADCEPEPRQLDGRRATERQKRLREQREDGDRKHTKRPASKSHKKKPKELGSEQTNGWQSHERYDSASVGRDQPPPNKKPKTSHRASGSVHSLNGTPAVNESRKRAFSNVQSYPSPTKSPQDHPQFQVVPTYTLDFLQLYEQDQGKENVSKAENIYTLNATAKLSDWERDPELLAKDSGQPNIDQPFIRSDAPLHRSSWPHVVVECKTNSDGGIDGNHPKWKLLRLQTPVQKDHLVGEIKGQIGLLAEYCQDKSTRWQELRHPEPFVFFNPSMPIYIDSRREGTQFRYIRRSCHPNVTLKTYRTTDGQYHYCFVASDNLSAGTELTTQWYMDRQDSHKPDEAELSLWASRLLANFGDCACDKILQPCRLANLDRRRPLKSADVLSKQPRAGRRKVKNKQAISPLSTGQATNSRAGSENIKVLEDDDQDSHSVSGSSRSKSRSRDRTPSGQGLLDTDPVLGPELTDREKRKIALLEKGFEPAQRKKKRTSAGSTLNTPTAASSHVPGQLATSMPTTPSLSNRPTYINASTSNHFSGSPPPLRPSESRKISNQSPRHNSTPTTPSMLSPTSRPSYVDKAVQTEPEEPEYSGPPPKRRKFMTYNQRLLQKIHADRLRYEQEQLVRKEMQSGTTPSPVTSSPDAARISGDVEMRDVSVASTSPAESPVSAKKTLDASPTTSDMSTPLPSQIAHSHAALHPPNGQRFQLSSLPPVPTFSTTQSTSSSIPSSTPAALAISTSQSLFNFGAGLTSYLGMSNATVAPSPTRKKLSLGDYISRRSNLTAPPTVEKTQCSASGSGFGASVPRESPAKKSEECNAEAVSPVTILELNESIKVEAESLGGLNGSAIVDTPVKDESAGEPLNRVTFVPELARVGELAADPPDRALAKPGAIAPELANVLSALQAFTRTPGQQHSHSATSS